jgi:hypothetical protein
MRAGESHAINTFDVAYLSKGKMPKQSLNQPIKRRWANLSEVRTED